MAGVHSNSSWQHHQHQHQHCTTPTAKGHAAQVSLRLCLVILCRLRSLIEISFRPVYESHEDASAPKSRQIDFKGEPPENGQRERERERARTQIRSGLSTLTSLPELSRNHAMRCDAIYLRDVWSWALRWSLLVDDGLWMMDDGWEGDE